MKNKLFCLLLCLTVILTVFAPAANAEHTYTVAEADSLCDGIVDYKDGVSAQHFINNGLCSSAGISAEFYVIALSQRGSFDFSSYEAALLRYLDTHEVYSATSREKFALALIAAGSSDSYIAETADEAIGGQGLMSLVFGLHLLNNGCQSKLYSAEGLINTILGYQLSDGGWAVIGSRGDTDVTAMTLQALAPYYHVYSDVEAGVNRALKLLSEIQQPDGGYIGMGVENCESAVQVLTALSDLGIDPNSDPRFIKNGCSVLDAILAYRNADGSFAHVGSGFNETATMEAFYGLTAYRRYCRGEGSLYVLDQRRPPYQKAVMPTAKPQKTPASRQSGGSRSDDSAPVDHPAPQNQSAGDDHSGSVGNGRAAESVAYIDGQPETKPTQRATESKKKTASEMPTDPAATSAPTQPTVNNGSGAGLFQPDATSAPATADEAAPSQKGGYKPYAIAAILVSAAVAALILLLLKKRSKKHFIAVAILAAIGVLFVLLTNFESKESYHTVFEKSDAVGTVTLSVRCDTLKNDKKPDRIPDDCIILDETEFEITDGDTVYDILLEASKRYELQIDNRGASNAAYIAGIQYLYEFDYGDLSGWMYRVNGEFPDVGCQSYALHDGDAIEWLYTKNIGKDLE